MPNWCSNSLSIAGEENELKRFMEVGRSPDKHLDTLVFVPYPPEQKEIDDKLAEWAKIRNESVNSWGDMSKPKDWFNQGGLDWCINNWGTKWGICDCGPGALLNGTLSYGFSSAWSPPDKVVIAMGKLFPKLNFTLTYEETGDAFQGELIINNGEVISDETWDYEEPEEDEDE